MSMDGVLRLYFGESNLPTPDYIKQAAIRAMHDGFTFYTENAGLPSTRRALAAHYRKLHGVELDPAKEIVVTASGVQALNLAVRCALDPGDHAIVLTPAWPNGSANVMLSNAVVHEIPHPLCGDRYRIDFDALERKVTPRTRLLVYTSPSNPLGWVATEEEQQGLLDFTRRHHLWLLADEVYDRLYYAGASLGAPVPSILRKATRDDAVIVAQSFSKTYCMTGWRLGYLVARRDMAAKVTQTNEFVVSCAPSFTQKAGETALADGEGELLAHVAAPEGKSRPLPRRAFGNLRHYRAQARRRLLRVSAYRRPHGFVRLLPAPARRNARRPRAGRGVWSGRRRICPNMLCCGTIDS